MSFFELIKKRESVRGIVTVDKVLENFTKY